MRATAEDSRLLELTTTFFANEHQIRGLQAGGQRFGYALFFMTDGDLAYLRKSGGWDIGTGPSIVIVDLYAFASGQQGLMAGLGLQGSKITPNQIRLEGSRR